MKRIVTIGGGSGSYAVLRGLRDAQVHLSAIVTMFDSGGSSGILRDEYGVLPPGDVRRCLVALSGENERVLRDLFNYRFADTPSLHGHSFGNLFLTALSSIYGSDLEAIRHAEKILGVQGRVLPVSLSSSHLIAELEDGSRIRGETNIDIPKHDGALRITKLSLDPEVTIHEEAAKAIQEADLIVLCPGDLYTSLLPNMLVHGMREALAQRRGAVVYVSNLMTKWGETNGYCASDIVLEILRYGKLEQLDTMLVNSAPVPPERLLAYATEGKEPIVCDEKVPQLVRSVMQMDLLAEGDIVRHDSHKLGAALLSLLHNKRPILIMDMDDTLFDSSGRPDESIDGIALFDKAREFLERAPYEKVLVTRGEKAMQEAKIRKLRVKDLFDDVFIVPAGGSKLQVFQEIASTAQGRRIYVVGNRIDEEIRFGNLCGAMTILYDHGKYRSYTARDGHEIPTKRVKDYEELGGVLIPVPTQ